LSEIFETGEQIDYCTWQVLHMHTTIKGLLSLSQLVTSVSSYSILKSGCNISIVSVTIMHNSWYPNFVSVNHYILHQFLGIIPIPMYL